MNHSHLKRNLYFKGKLLKAKDFEEEQQYYLHRLQTLGTLFEPGIIKGLKVIDDQEGRIVVKKGCAINNKGDILQVDDDISTYVNEIEGFELINDAIMDLYLTSNEIPCEPIANLQQSNEEVFSKIEDTISLYLKPHYESFLNRSCFYETLMLYEDDDLVAFQYIPRYINEHGSFLINIEVFKKRTNAISYGLKYELFSYSIHTEKQEGTIINIEKHDMKDRKESYQFRLYHDNHDYASFLTFTIRNDIIKIMKGDIEFNASLIYEETFSIVSDIHLKIETLCREQMQVDIESKQIPLAVITIASNDEGELMIQRIENKEPIEHTSTPYLSSYTQRMLSLLGYQKEESSSKQLTSIMGKISLKEFKKSEEEIYYSEKIYLNERKDWYFDVCLITKEKISSKPIKSFTLFGNRNLFETNHNNEKIEKAIRYDKNNNCIEIAIKVPYSMQSRILSVCWTAVEVQEEKRMEELKLISLKPSLVSLKPNDNCLFTPIFNKEEKSDCTFQVISENGGRIDEHGMYYAPQVAGVYKVTASDKCGNSVDAFINVEESDTHV